MRRSRSHLAAIPGSLVSIHHLVPPHCLCQWSRLAALLRNHSTGAWLCNQGRQQRDRLLCLPPLRNTHTAETLCLLYQGEIFFFPNLPAEKTSDTIESMVHDKLGYVYSVRTP